MSQKHSMPVVFSPISLLRKLYQYTIIGMVSDLRPDENHTWITEGLHSDFTKFVPIGSKEAKATQSTGTEVKTVFKLYSPGMQTGRDNWMFDFNRARLVVKA